MFYKFIFFIKNLFSKKEKNVINDEIKVENINWGLINQLCKNDIVWVKMNKEEIEKAKIMEGHQERPFLITCKNDNLKEATGYYFSSNINSNYVLYSLGNSRLVLDATKYNLKKDSILMCDKKITLPYENIERKIDTLKLNDLKKLKLYIQNIENGDKDLSEVIDIRYLNVGKIISLVDRYYVVYQKEKKDIYCFNIKKSNVYFNELDDEEKLYYFKYNRNYYKVNYDERLHINENNLFSIKIIDELSSSELEKILRNRKQIKYNKKKIKRLRKKQKRR